MREARIGATAMAVLPFLGAGQTHKEGEYKDTVNQGLYFLKRHMQLGDHGGSLYEEHGWMYSHGLASIVLCEAYAMTHDQNLRASAQAAVDFIGYAQDPIGGGWRYEPQQPGDTSMFGWQIMALKSGHMASLHVPPIVVKKAYVFLDSVQTEGGAYYGYTSPGNRNATTAIGLLCRMYLGWKRDNPALQHGARFISNKGPSSRNMYYNYYATQVMYHLGGDRWEKWNGVMRDQLVNSQSRLGHEAGSWATDNDFGGKKGIDHRRKKGFDHRSKKGFDHDRMSDRDYGSISGGRLYRTSMATMILEVYYRYLPIFRERSIEEDFPQ